MVRSVGTKSGVGVRSTVNVAVCVVSVATLAPVRLVSTMSLNDTGNSSSAWASADTLMGKRMSRPPLPRSGRFCIDMTTTVYFVLFSLRSDNVWPSVRSSMRIALLPLFA